tara:strand:+ start:17202 stop:17474 length:273 start_codon:yes stop_codon:yes gene_type:complete
MTKFSLTTFLQIALIFFLVVNMYSFNIIENMYFYGLFKSFFLYNLFVIFFSFQFLTKDYSEFIKMDEISTDETFMNMYNFQKKYSLLVWF